VQDGTWPYFGPDELDAVANVLKSGRVNYWTGQEGRHFESDFAAWCGTKHAIAMANGSVTIEACVHALGLKPGDDFVTTPRTFVASSSVCVLQGLRPVFADVDPDSGNITPESIERVLTPKTKLILPVHLAGWPCDMPGIMDLAGSIGAFVIEDCAQAHGAKIGDRNVGTYGEINTWSFCQDKIMTLGGEGGMVTTDADELWSSAWSYKDHGKNYESVYRKDHPIGFRWLHDTWGTNLRLTEMQSAIGRRQLQKLPQWTAARTANAQILASYLASCPAVRVPQVPDGYTHAYYKFYAYVLPEALADGWSRDRIMTEISAQGLPAYSGSCSEIYLEKAFDGTDSRPKERLPMARELGDTSLMFLVHPTLDEAKMHQYGEAIQTVLRKATK